MGTIIPWWMIFLSFIVGAAIIWAFLSYLMRVQRQIDAEEAAAALASGKTGKVAAFTPARAPSAGPKAAPKRTAPPPPPDPVVTVSAEALPTKIPFPVLMSDLMQCHHLLIIGPTDAGKSTAARAVMAHRARFGERIIILDPHATPRTWSGLQAIGGGRDYHAIADAMDKLLGELSQRYQAAQEEDAEEPQSLTIVVDEWSSIQTKCGKLASTFITELAQEGRKVKMRLMMMAHGDYVEDLGIPTGNVRNNFTMLLLGASAEQATDCSHLERPAALRQGYKGDAIPADVIGMESLASLILHPYSVWTPPPSIAQIAEIAETRGETVSASPETDVSALQEQSEAPENEDVSGFVSGQYEALARLIADGLIAETAGLKSVFGVKPGGSKAYLEAREKLKIVLDEMTMPTMMQQ